MLRMAPRFLGECRLDLIGAAAANPKLVAFADSWGDHLSGFTHFLLAQLALFMLHVRLGAVNAGN